MDKRLCDILSMCFRISRNSDADVFFEFSPHCDAYSVYYYRDGWTAGTAGNMEYMECVTKITSKNMRSTLAKLRALSYELGVV